MDHNQLKCFLVTAKDRSFTKASRELFISQPAISKTIKNLEEQLGYKLFIRNYHQLILTPEAEQLIPIAKNILKEMSAAYLLHVHAKRGINQFNLAFPNINIIINSYRQENSMLDALKNHQIDIGNILQQDAMNFNWVPQEKLNFNVYVSSNTRNKNENTISPEDLIDKTLLEVKLTPSNPFSIALKKVQRYLPYKEKLLFNGVQAALMTLKTIDSYMLLPSSTYFQDSKIKKLKIINLPSTINQCFRVGLAYPKNCSASVQAFINYYQLQLSAAD